MQETEINGFVIDQFNQYNLDTKATQGICPWSDEHRKPENRKKKCSSYDWERGLGTCHNCNTTYQLHTYQRKGSASKTYARPDALNVVDPKELGSKVFKWFESRGISNKTLNELNVTEGKEFMPQTGKSENTIQFNYIMGDELSLIHI